MLPTTRRIARFVEFALSNRSETFRIVVVTFASTGVMALVNAGCSVLIARALSPQRFSTYLSIVMVVSALMPFFRGVQAFSAIEFLNPKDVTDRTQKMRDESWLLTYTVYLFVLSIGLYYLISVSFAVSLSQWMAATGILVAALFQSRASGFFQGQKQFVPWQLAMALTSAIQVPLVLLFRETTSSPTPYLVVLTIPSLLFYIFGIWKFRFFCSAKTHRGFAVQRNSGLLSIAINFGSLAPLIIFSNLDSSIDRGQVTTLALVFHTVANVGYLLGSFKMTEYATRTAIRRGTFEAGQLKPHLLHAIPTSVLSAILLFFGSERILHLFGPQYAIILPTRVTVLMAVSYVLWTITLSLVSERLPFISGFLTLLVASTIGIQYCLVLLAKPSTTMFFSLHAGVAYVVGGLILLASPNGRPHRRPLRLSNMRIR